MWLLRIVSLGYLLLGSCFAQPREEAFRLDTPDYRIRMTVQFLPPCRGTRLVFCSSASPGKELCYSGNGDSQSCIERFVGAMAVVSFRIQPRRKNVAAAASLREVVQVLSQAEGLDERPRHIQAVSIVDGIVSDVQVFGYDEDMVAEGQRASLRAEWSAKLWRVYRQDLYVNGNSEPFAFVEWKHTLNGIELLRVKGQYAAVAP